MTQDDQIPLEILRGMPPEQINILLVQGFNSQVRSLDELKAHVQAYGELLEKKIGRDEYGEFKVKIHDRLDDHHKRIENIENIHENGTVKKDFAFNVGKYFWIIVLAIMNLLQFFYTIGSSNQ